MGIVLYSMKIRDYDGEILLLSARLPEAGGRPPGDRVLNIAFAWVLVDLGALEVAKGPGDKALLFTRCFGERCWELDAWWRGGGGEWAVVEAGAKAECGAVGHVDTGEKKVVSEVGGCAPRPKEGATSVDSGQKVVSEVGVRASRPKEGAARLRGPLAQADQNVG